MSQGAAAVRKYLEAQAWVDESRQAMEQADRNFTADRNEDARYELERAQYAWRRDLDIRMKRSADLTDEEYDAVMASRRAKENN